MNKLGIVLGIAAVAVIAGCKDPNYQRKSSKGEVKDVGTQVEQVPEAEPAPGPVDTPIVAEEQHCKCAPGTKHAEPCTCGAPDCQCIVVKATKKTEPGEVKKPVVPVTPIEPEYTVYIVQRGDYLAKISKKYNVTINSIKRLNNLKDDNIRIGQTLKLPGKINVGEQTAAPAPDKGTSTTAKKAYASYSGPTKEYVVKSGDTLGAIAYGHGINIRQLKELNGLTSDSLKIGQKLKVPAEKVVKAAAPAAPAKPAEKAAPAPVNPPAEATPAVAEQVPAPAPVVEETPVVAEQVPAPAPVVEEAPTQTYVVQEGDDLTDVSIRFGVSAAAVRELNNLGENDKLVPGQVLKLPADAQQQ